MLTIKLFAGVIKMILTLTQSINLIDEHNFEQRLDFEVELRSIIGSFKSIIGSCLVVSWIFRLLIDF